MSFHLGHKYFHTLCSWRKQESASSQASLTCSVCFLFVCSYGAVGMACGKSNNGEDAIRVSKSVTHETICIFKNWCWTSAACSLDVLYNTQFMMNNSTCTVTYCPLVSHAVSFRIQQQGRAVKLKVNGKPMADSCGCLVETNRILQSNYPSVKNKLTF